MRLKVAPFEIRLLVDTVDINPTGVFVDSEGEAQSLVNVQISAFKRLKRVVIPESTDEEGNVIPEQESWVPVDMTSPYKLDNPTSVPFVPFMFIGGLLQAVNSPEILPTINQQIEDVGYNDMFQGSLEGFKLDIEKVEV